ncbi:MAG: YARHG domain-containing protein [Bacteroidales bacterium]|nr:YARHG domain-containing protein [Bacteroidales bacterium]
MTQEQINQLTQLQKLYESGILTKEELTAEKAKILNSGSKNKSDNKIKHLFAKINGSKFRIPLLILLGMIFGFICIVIVSQFVPIFEKDYNIDKTSITEEVVDDIFEDKFERLWVIGSSRDYTEDDFKDWNKEDLRILRNYFFARNNFRFGSKELTNYFSKYSWYQALYSDVGDMFSDLQTNNVQFIKKLEGLPNYHH